ncbi:hypothetical protein LCGC14_0677950 [marine sediment metagenome]|uniref:Endonuclease/exonuclease/phosphatase family protein n=2 Tax=root TaxID=1 RepID=A0A831VRK4_9FLAO|nr:endonuclease/exonuclease/phosphatase family protein [Pricia antarctica]
MAARTQISFASFNLYNLNLPGKAIYQDTDGWSQEEYDRKIEWAATILKTMPARVWGFQELWHEDALKAVFEKAGLADDYDILTPPNHNGSRIVCAAAVEKGLLDGEPEWMVNFPENFILQSTGDDPQTPDMKISIDKFSRPALRFSIKPRAEGESISIYVAHLKSKSPSDIWREGWYRADTDFYKRHRTHLGYTISTIRRSAEASALRMLIIEELKDTDRPLVVIGDLNDSQLSNTLNILTGQPNYLVSGLSKGGTDTGLYTVATLEEYRSLRDVYYTHIYQNIKESLDHILVSQEFYDASRKRIWAYKGMEITNDHLNTDNHKQTGTSDHGVVKATFEYRPI